MQQIQTSYSLTYRNLILYMLIILILILALFLLKIFGLYDDIIQLIELPFILIKNAIFGKPKLNLTEMTLAQAQILGLEKNIVGTVNNGKINYGHI